MAGGSGIRNTFSELKQAAKDAILSDGTPFDGAKIDAAISSRSSHSWDPDGVVPTSGTLARQSDVSDLQSTEGKGLVYDGTSKTLVDLGVSGSGIFWVHPVDYGNFDSVFQLQVDYGGSIGWSEITDQNFVAGDASKFRINNTTSSDYQVIVFKVQ